MADINKIMNQLGREKFEPNDPIAKLNAKLDAITNYMGLTVKPIGDGVFEVIKETVASGDYLDPILFVPPMNVEEGKWYYTEEIGKDLPRECMTDANNVTDFDNSMVFDWV